MLTKSESARSSLHIAEGVGGMSAHFGLMSKAECGMLAPYLLSRSDRKISYAGAAEEPHVPCRERRQ